MDTAAIFILSTYLLVSVNPLGQKEEKSSSTAFVTRCSVGQSEYLRKRPTSCPVLWYDIVVHGKCKSDWVVNGHMDKAAEYTRHGYIYIRRASWYYTKSRVEQESKYVHGQGVYLGKLYNPPPPFYLLKIGTYGSGSK